MMRENNHTSRMAHRATRITGRRAFSIVEACVSIVVVAVMLSTSLIVAGAVARNRIAQQTSTRATALAQHLLGQIVQLPYEQPGAVTNSLGPEAGELRATFNDVDDFNGYSESPPLDPSGTPLPGFSGWTRRVSVEWVTPSSTGAEMTAAPTETGIKRIAVTVVSPAGKYTTLTALRTRQSMYEKVPLAPATYTSWFGVSMQVGTDPSTAVHEGVNVMNQVP